MAKHESNALKPSSAAGFNLNLSRAMMILCFSIFNICILQSIFTNFHNYNDLNESTMQLDLHHTFRQESVSTLRSNRRTTTPPPPAHPETTEFTPTLQRPTVLVTGGCGYIGSHTIVLLLQEGYNVVVVDNLINSSPVSLDRVASIVGLTDPEERAQRLRFYQVDICNEAQFRQVFLQHQEQPFHAVIHFAGLKAVGESTHMPLRYYENNLIGTFILLRLMDEFDCHKIVFSSSATVYGNVERMPITEDTPTGTGITNAYGRTKYMIEQVLQDFYHSKTLDTNATTTTDWSITILRYFNPVGAHPSGLIGEDPHGIPNNLMPFVAQVAVGRRAYVTVFGNDYDTVDGTGVRDYIHVMDLSEGHVASLQYMDRKGNGVFVFNLGTGNGTSVLQMCQAMSEVCGHDIPYQMGPRRPGDIAICYADPTKAEQEMGWKAKYNLKEMCQDLWNWQSNNPHGYAVVGNATDAASK
jgi:UDP-glucose 4-epimerase